MRSSPVVALIACVLGAGSALGADEPLREPIPTRTQHPFSLLFLDLPVAGAETLPAGSVEGGLQATYTSLTTSGTGDRFRATFDGEIARAVATTRWGVAEGIELSLEVPVVYASGGFLDHFVRQFHQALGLPGPSSGDRPANAFEMQASRDGRTFFELEPHEVGFGDANVSTKWRLLSETSAPLSLAARAGLEPPTGDSSRGLGSGTWDAGVGLVGQRSFGPVSLFLDVDVMFPDLFGEYAVAKPEPFVSVSPAVRVDVSRAVALDVEVDANSSILPSADVGELGDAQMELVVGASVRLGERTTLDLAFTEDLLPKTSPDFTAITGLRVRF